ncbi:MAG: MoxR family ATPase [Lentisphaeria bacterium]|nr:MoxR family ATPase [Lentisphaeria bacterium]
MENNSLLQEIRTVKQEMLRIIRGKESTIDLLLNAVLAGGSVLMDDVPGVGKTTLAKSLAVTLNVDFKRIQFTPDLLPADVTGGSIYNPQTGEFVLHKGPVFTNVVLADEINRASPRTQSALLEAMNEKQITLEGTVYPLPDPFFVIATENPVEYFGTYPLPEAQLDRFYMKLTLGYPDENAELAMLKDRLNGDPAMDIKPVLRPGGLLEIRNAINQVEIVEPVTKYILEIIRKTRTDERIQLGASPRAFLILTQCARTRAWMQERSFVTPDDVKDLAIHVLAHRIILNTQNGLTSDNAETVISDILRSVRVPA